MLVVDDDADIRALLTIGLRRAGYDVLSAADGDEGLRLARELLPDLALLDVSMPGRNGYEVCHELQTHGRSAPPVIFLSAQRETDDRVAGLDSGAVDYVGKPFEFDELSARVRAALRTKGVRDALATAAVRDPVTGLLNRLGLDERAAEAVAAASRYGRALSCVMLDVDHFKGINDVHGHAAGDAVLREVAARLGGCARKSDPVGRYGGEEFVVLLPETDIDGAGVVAEKLIGVLRDSAVSIGPNVAVRVTASAGVAALAQEMTSYESLYAEADRALLEAKRLGRDRVGFARSDPPHGALAG